MQLVRTINAPGNITDRQFERYSSYNDRWSAATQLVGDAIDFVRPDSSDGAVRLASEGLRGLEQLRSEFSRSTGPIDLQIASSLAAPIEHVRHGLQLLRNPSSPDALQRAALSFLAAYTSTDSQVLFDATPVPDLDLAEA